MPLLGVLRNPQRLTFYSKILSIYQIRWIICQYLEVFIKIPIFIDIFEELRELPTILENHNFLGKIACIFGK